MYVARSITAQKREVDKDGECHDQGEREQVCDERSYLIDVLYSDIPHPSAVSGIFPLESLWDSLVLNYWTKYIGLSVIGIHHDSSQRDGPRDH